MFRHPNIEYKAKLFKENGLPLKGCLKTIIFYPPVLAWVQSTFGEVITTALIIEKAMWITLLFDDIMIYIT